MIQQHLGQQILKKVAGETYKAYLPPLLPLQPPLALEQLSGLLEKSAASLAELNNMSKFIPSIPLFIYMYVRKEALLSSQIEGTNSSFSDLVLFENQQKPAVALDDVEEVSNYVKAIYHGLQRLSNGFPLSMRLLREIHAILLSGARGAQKLPGEFRKSQNWIGGTRPGNALFVPPPVENLAACLTNLEAFLHDDTLPVLVKAAIAHVQFETIHPFLDGNGRLGRLLVILLLVEGGLMDEPILYFSLYLKQNRNTYYHLLQEVRMHGRWEAWLEFFLNGVLQTSQQTIAATTQINALFQADLLMVNRLGRARFSCQQVLEYLKKLPQTSVASLAKALAISLPTARSSLNYLVELGIVQEVSGKQRDKCYVYKKYLDILESGAEPLSD